jgi:hypothetical protein
LQSLGALKFGDARSFESWRLPPMTCLFTTRLSFVTRAVRYWAPLHWMHRGWLASISQCDPTRQSLGALTVR